jgi:hypothetical protein
MSSVHHAEQRPPHSLPNSIQGLRAALLGRVIAPDDPECESARLVVNAAFDRRPAPIIRPCDFADRRIAPDFLVGTSAGALNAAFAASRPQTPATAKEFWEASRRPAHSRWRRGFAAA